MKNNATNILIALALILIAVSLRILPHPANFAPVAAVALFGGSVLPRRIGLWVPLAVMIISDAIIGLHDLVAVTWGCYVLIALAGSHWLRKPTILKGAALAISSSIFFFIATNFAVWVKSGMYEHSFNGLGQCYLLALPFFRNTLLSDLIYTGLLFVIYAITTRLSSKILRGLSPLQLAGH